MLTRELLFILFYVSNDFCGISANNVIVRDVFHNNAPGANGYIVANLYSTNNYYRPA